MIDPEIDGKGNKEIALTLIRDGAEYPIICDGHNHYYFADLYHFRRCEDPFEKCPHFHRGMEGNNASKS